MKRNQGFDMLDNADDMTIDRLSEEPVLTAKEKERILKMSKEKLRRRYETLAAADNMSGNTNTIEVSRRPKMHSFAAVAASFVLVSGLVGTGIMMSKKGAAQNDNNNKLPMAATTTVVTTLAPENTTSAIASGDITDTTDTNANEDLSAKTVELFNSLNELVWMNYGTHVGCSTIDTANIEFDGEDYTYYRVVDDRFGTMDQAQNYFQQTVTGTVWREGFYTTFKDTFAPAIFREYDGDLYVLFSQKNYSEADVNVFTDIEKPEISNVADDRFEYRFNAKNHGIDYIVTGSAVREDDKWKIDFYQLTAKDDVEVITVPASEDPTASAAINDNNAASNDNTSTNTAEISTTAAASEYDPYSSENPLRAPRVPEPENLSSMTTEEFFIYNCKCEATLRWNEVLDQGYENVFMEYTLYDIDGDGSREFLLKYGTCEADYRINVYTYKHGYLEQVAQLGGGHTMFCYDTETGELVIAWGHMGAGAYNWYKLENSTLTETRDEQVDYSIIGKDEKLFENVRGLPSYGAYSLSDGTITSFASDGDNYYEVDGLDLSFIK